MKMQEILKKINSYHPDSIDIKQEKNIIFLEFRVNLFNIFIQFNENFQKNSYCYITYSGNYFFSTKNNLKFIFEYIYLILTKDSSKNLLMIK